MKTLLLYRHGEAGKNEKVKIDGVLEDVVGGRASSSGLTVNGEGHARNVGNRLLHLREQGTVNPDRLFLASSTAVRARQTLEIAAAQAGFAHLGVHYRFDLEEFDQGSWTGHPKSKPLILPDGTAVEYVPPHRRSQDYNIGGTETLRGATDRVMAGLQVVADMTPEGGVGLVSGHGITNRLAAIAISGVDILGTKMDYGAETRITIDGQDWHVDYVGLPTHEPDMSIANAMWHP